MHVLSSFRITVIQYVIGTRAACMIDLSFIIVIRKGKDMGRVYVKKEWDLWNLKINFKRMKCLGMNLRMPFAVKWKSK
ncbi:hypothetical protein COE15_15575 [Bacillus cereus]|nr:hypothetical protein CN288_06495 [Bacillus sp. AFS023182]PGX99212.1 hypothetical protein COE15_15575 [Bacillus cereus]